MNWRALVVIGALALPMLPADAQLALPGASPSDSAPAPAAPAKRKKAAAREATTAKPETPQSSDVATIAGRPLMLNGGSGLLQVSGSGDTLQVDKLRLAGESVSDSSQRCVVDIVGEKPILAKSDGRPDGLERYSVDVPACPFTFDVLDGAVLVPSQITACVFKAADCQTSPGGLWGPDGASLEADAAAIGKQRTQAENAMAKALHAIDERASANPDAANILRDQNGFPGARDDACRDYVKESAHGYCAASLTAARAALLDARLTAMADSAAKTDKAAKPQKSAKKKKKPADNAAAEQPQ
jgi:hypothetical protein